MMNRLSPRLAAVQPATRNPERSRERILAAAFKEFAAHGFAGARVDRIVRRAGINKRMLYHYFGDKEGLFREVLRRKMAQRQAWGVATPDDPTESLPFWFDNSCQDVDWIRLLEWEALQFVEQRLIDEQKRREAAQTALQRIRRRQRLGHLSNEFDARHILLAMIGLTWLPLAFPRPRLPPPVRECAVSAPFRHRVSGAPTPSELGAEGARRRTQKEPHTI